ncbi:MAG: stem cell self-renewal protein Piwi domain-containing protein [Bryobacteraceae bacterium]|nr:stem cell self-renewal protein Piwi domain-containing protein [Bryobacteraceae bacterium]
MASYTPSSSLLTNGFRLSLSAPAFRLHRREIPDPKSLKGVREANPDWFIWWRGGIAYSIPVSTKPSTQFGESFDASCADYLPLLAARIQDLLPEKFPEYRLLQRRPFSFVGRKGELVAAVSARLKNPPPLLKHFKIHPMFRLEAKVLEPRTDDAFLGLFVGIRTRSEISAPLMDLVSEGIDLVNLYVVRRTTLPGQRHLIGRIQRVDGGKVYLAESFDDSREISCDSVFLEGSKASFARCLRTLLGDYYGSFEETRWSEEANLLNASAVQQLMDRFAGFFSKSPMFAVAPGLQCTIQEQIGIANTLEYKSVVLSPPVQYCFDASRSKQSPYAWAGLMNHGPFSRDTFAKRSPEILVVFPDTMQGHVERFLRSLRDGVVTSGRQSQFPGGFAKLFGLANPSFQLCKVPVLTDSQSAPGNLYRRTIEKDLRNRSHTPDAALVILSDEHAALPDPDCPYIQSKAILMLAGVPTQQMRFSRISKPPYEVQYILQNVCTALYAKLNGTPWTVSQDKTISDELVIGLGMCELADSRFAKKERFVGITTVFRGDGNYLLSHISQESSYENYPVVLQQSTVAILEEIRQRNGWSRGDTIRIIFHSYKPLKKVEVASVVKNAVEAIGSDFQIEFAFLTVTQDHPFLVIDPGQHGHSSQRNPGAVKGKLVPERGTITQIGRYTRLLSTNGPILMKRANAPLPAPLLIHLHENSTFCDLTYLSEQVLKFTSLSWRSTLPAKKPVSIYYSELIAEMLARLQRVAGWSPAVVNLKLRASRWFL